MEQDIQEFKNYLKQLKFKIEPDRFKTFFSTNDRSNVLMDSSHPLLVLPEQNSNSHILNALIDDCLRKIFQYLTVFDLARVADTCVHFNKLAKTVFNSKFKHLDCYSNFFEKNNVLLTLLTFGSSIQSLNLSSYVVVELVFHMLYWKCKKLKKLTLFDVYYYGYEYEIRSQIAKNDEWAFNLIVAQLETLNVENEPADWDFGSILHPMSELFTIDNFKKILTYANRLSLFTLKSFEGIRINIDDYKEILETVQKRPEQVRLDIIIRTSKQQVNIPEDVLNKNRGILYIQEHIEECYQERLESEISNGFNEAPLDMRNWSPSYLDQCENIDYEFF